MCAGRYGSYRLNSVDRARLMRAGIAKSRQRQAALKAEVWYTQARTRRVAHGCTRQGTVRTRCALLRVGVRAGSASLMV